MIPADPPSRTWVWAAATHVMAARHVGENEVALRVAWQALGTAEQLDVPDAQADLLISLAVLEGGGRRTEAGRERLREAWSWPGGRAAPRGDARAVQSRRRLLRVRAPRRVSALAHRRAGPCPSRRAAVVAVSDGDALPPAAGAVHAGPLGRLCPGGARRCRRAARGRRVHDGARAVRRPRARRPQGHRPGAGPAGGALRLDGHARRGYRADRRGGVAGRCGGRRTADAVHRRGADRRHGRASPRHRPAGHPRVVRGRRPGRRSAPQGDQDGARRWAETATELVELARTAAVHGEGGMAQGPEGQAWLARAEAEWTRAASGPDADAWARAVAAFDFGDVYEPARCRLRYAEALLAADRREEAAAEARAAREVFARLGATVLLEQLDELIRRGRLVEAPSTASLLTAREQDVLRLLARGAATARSARSCTSPARRRVCMSPTSWPSWARRAAPRPWPSPTARG